MKRAPERIETARLMLCRPTLADADAIFARYASDPEVTKYLGWPRHKTVKDTRQFLSFSDAEWARGHAGPYLIESRDTGTLLGSTGLMFPAAEVALTGYVLARDAWGKGFATEALRAMVDLARELAVIDLRALCHPDNTASIHVLEKCGFTREGLVPELFPNLDPGRPIACLRFIRLLGS